MRPLMRLMTLLLFAVTLAACSTTRTPAPPTSMGKKIYADQKTEVYVGGGVRFDAVAHN